MKKIYYDNNGWICERYPYNIPKSDKYIEVDDEKYESSLSCKLHYAWKLVNNDLKEEQYEEIPEDELLDDLRFQRNIECFPIINRGQTWYNTYVNTDERKQELQKWYKDWLDVTTTKIIPKKPNWLI